MEKTPHVKQRFFTVRELRISLAMIILLSFLSAVVFMYLIKVFGDSLKEHSIMAFVLVMIGYAILVGVLTAIFTHRFIGPFERLRYEIGVILGGNYEKRLRIRRQDDAYVRSFVEDVNKVVMLLEESDRTSVGIRKDIYLELSSIINKIDSADPSLLKHREELSKLRDRLSASLIHSGSGTGQKKAT
jgi:hypothetical protein